jgi:hypothetical protein
VVEIAEEQQIVVNDAATGQAQATIDLGVANAAA